MLVLELNEDLIAVHDDGAQEDGVVLVAARPPRGRDAAEQPAAHPHPVLPPQRCLCGV